MNTSSKIQTVMFRKAPILEAIFEMRWELSQVPNTQVYRDPSYPLLYGRLYDRFKKDYPLAEDLPATQVHPDASPYAPRHRIRKTQEGWPFVQVGPGIMTVHEGKEYSWTNFREQIIRIAEALTDFYPASTFPLNILKTELRFINGFEIKQGEDLLKIFSDRLHTSVKLDESLFSATNVKPDPEALSMTAGFKIEKPVGNAILAMGSGGIDNQPALLHQMTFHSVLENAPQDLGSLDLWLDSMHSIAKSWHLSLVKAPVAVS